MKGTQFNAHVNFSFRTFFLELSRGRTPRGFSSAGRELLALKPRASANNLVREGVVVKRGGESHRRLQSAIRVTPSRAPPHFRRVRPPFCPAAIDIECRRLRRSRRTISFVTERTTCGSASPPKSRTTRTAWHDPAGARPRHTTAIRSSCRRARATAAASPTTSTRPPARRSSPTADEVCAKAEMIVKVKEPIAAEYAASADGQTPLHLPPPRAGPELTDALLKRSHRRRVRDDHGRADGSLPLLDADERGRGTDGDPGRRQLPQKPNGGRGVLLGGVPGVRRPTSSSSAAASSARTRRRWRSASAPTSRSSTSNVDRLRYLDDIFHGRVIDRSRRTPRTSPRRVRSADLVIGAVLSPAPRRRSSSRAT